MIHIKENIKSKIDKYIDFLKRENTQKKDFQKWKKTRKPKPNVSLGDTIYGSKTGRKFRVIAGADFGGVRLQEIILREGSEELGVVIDLNEMQVSSLVKSPLEDNSFECDI